MRLFSYDAAGNPLNNGLRSDTWRSSGQLARVAYSGVVTDYTYNGFNQRLRKTSAGVTTYYSYDEAGHLQGEYAADGSLLAEHLWLGDTPVATVQRQADGSLATYYVFADHIDTPRALSDANGKILWRWDGEGFGRSPPDADADGDGVALTYNLRFPGQVFDKESNLHYNWNRYYDPVTGRYVSSDPIGLAGGSFSTYGYVGGNPVSQFDPMGLADQWYGYDNPRFRDWAHQQKQDMGKRGDDNFTRKEVDDLYKEWQEEGQPRGKGGKSGKGGSGRGRQGGKVCLPLLNQITAAAILLLAPRNIFQQCPERESCDPAMNGN